jgi:hypothetical protein
MVSARMARLVGALGLWAGGSAAAATLNVDIQKKYGAVTLSSINRAIDEARAHFAASPNDIVVLNVPAGVFTLDLAAGAPTLIDVSNVTPGPGGQLVLRGAGKDRTTLVFDADHPQMLGSNTHRVAFEGLHFTSNHLRASQGHVVQALEDAVDVQLEPGFPTPAEMADPNAARGAYLRRCTDSATAPQLEPDDNVQVHWWRAEPVAPRVWRFDLRRHPDSAKLPVGSLVAIKGWSRPDGTFQFVNSSDLTFDDVEWTRATRGVFRGGTYNVKLLNSAIARDPPTEGHVPCIESSGGGPQFGQPRDPPMTGIVVRNFTAAGTGDDALGFFNASGTLDHVRVTDAFARGILLFRSSGMALNDVETERAPILRKDELRPLPRARAQGRAPE